MALATRLHDANVITAWVCRHNRMLVRAAPPIHWLAGVARRRVKPRVTGPARPSMSASVQEAAPVVEEEPLFRLGIVTDVQYADIDDGASFMGTPRYYRNALVGLRHAVQAWLGVPRLRAVLHLGDILDGLQARDGVDASEAALGQVLDAFSVLSAARQVPVLHCLGNHCLLNLPRARLHHRLGIDAAPDAGGAACYTLSPHAGYRVVVLDSYDVSVAGGSTPANQELAASILAAKNPHNENKNSPEGLEGLDRRFVAFGGGMSTAQLAWLDAVLAAADASRERVFVAVHTPVCPSSSPAVCLSWEYEAVLALCAAHPSCVATLAGHAHGGGYALDAAGVHHFVFPAVLECPPGEHAFGHIDVLPHGFRIRGTGRLESTELLHYRPWLAAAGGVEALSEDLAKL